MEGQVSAKEEGAGTAKTTKDRKGMDGSWVTAGHSSREPRSPDPTSTGHWGQRLGWGTNKSTICTA